MRTVVKSSGAEPYEILVEQGAGGVTLTCGCQAGAMGQHCKHKAALIEGDLSFAVPGHEGGFREAHAALQASGIPAAYQAYKEEQDAIEKQMDVLKKQAKTSKAMFARRLSEGL